MQNDKDMILEIMNYGLSEKEAVFYYQAIQMSTFSITKISQMSGLKRPTCYLLVESLIEKGLVSRLASGVKKLYKAESPDMLSEMLERQRQKTHVIVSKLKALENRNKDQTEIKLHTGKIGVQKVYNQMINQKYTKDIYYFGSVEQIIETAGELFVDHWIKERIKKGVWAHGIRMESKEFPKKLYESSPDNLRELFFPPEDFSIKNTIYFYHKTFILTGKNENEPFALVVNSSNLVETMMSLYESMKKVSGKN